MYDDYLNIDKCDRVLRRRSRRQKLPSGGKSSVPVCEPEDISHDNVKEENNQRGNKRVSY